MKKIELIKAIKNAGLEDEQMYLVDEEKGKLFYPVEITDNIIIFLHDTTEKENRFDIEIRTVAKMTGKCLIEHFEKYPGNKDIGALHVAGGYYDLTECHFDFPEELRKELERIPFNIIEPLPDFTASPT